MTNSLQTTPTNFEPVRGMSDEEELKRYSNYMQNQPLGEELVNISDDLKELGFEVGDGVN